MCKISSYSPSPPDTDRNSDTKGLRFLHLCDIMNSRTLKGGYKMKKIACLTVIIALIFVVFTSCSGYNRTMRDHLGNADNYQTFEVILKDLYYIDTSTNEKVRNFSGDDFLDKDIIFEVSFFNNIEELKPFLGSTPSEDIPLEEYKFQFSVTKENSKILFLNDFYNCVSLEEKISVKVSSYIYMDSEFFYIAQVEHDGIEYLSFEEGLKNIVDMMDKDKSLF